MSLDVSSLVTAAWAKLNWDNLTQKCTKAYRAACQPYEISLHEGDLVYFLLYLDRILWAIVCSRHCLTHQDCFKSTWRGCPARFVWLKVVSFDRSLLKEEALRFSVFFTHPLPWERPLQCRAWVFIVPYLNLHGNRHGNGHGSGHCNGHGNGHETDTDMDMDLQTWTRIQTRTQNWLTFAMYKYGATVPIVLSGFPMTHQGASPKGTMYL
jgi:hypothetical protein